MCMFMTLLSHANECRMIAQCEHGTLHITWDISTVRLRQDEFLTLARFLKERASGPAPTVSEGWCRLERDAHRTHRLWIGQIGVVVAAEDFAILNTLIEDAASALSVAASSTSSLSYPLLTIRPESLGLN
jgi:hypothetical protein